jgi:hypothetical protein
MYLFKKERKKKEEKEEEEATMINNKKIIGCSIKTHAHRPQNINK